MEEARNKPKYKVYKRKDKLLEPDAWKKAQAEFEQLFPVVERLVIESHPEIALPVLNAICQISPRYAGDEPKLSQSELELLQALFMRHKLSSFTRSNMDFDSLIEATDALAERFFKKRPSAEAFFSPDSSNEAHDHFREKARVAAQFIRNWSQPDRMWDISLALFSTVDDEFFKAYGVTASGLVTMLKTTTRNLDQEIKQKIESHRHQIDLTSPPSIRAFYLDLSESFWLTIDDFAGSYPDEVNRPALETVLHKWAMQFGDLSNWDPEHLFMGNPVRLRPLIIHEHLPGYFLPFPQLIQTFCLEMIQSLILPKRKLKKRYETKRAQFLQHRLEKLFEFNFPALPVYANCKWTANGENGEVDVLLPAEPLILVVEAKSAKIEETAKRGGDNLFQELVKDVIVYSAIQMDRFTTLLRNELRMHTLTDKVGQAISIDARLFSQILPLTITLDTAYIQWDWKRLSDAGQVDKNIVHPLVLSIADLETIFEVITLEAEKLYYLQARSRFQAQFEFIGDELDILGAYVEGHLPRRPGSFAGSLIDFTGCSSELDNYFARKGLEPTVEKPCIRRTELWTLLLQQLETKRPFGWVEASFLLLNIGYESQVDFENQLDQQAAKLLASPNRSDSWHWPLEISTPERQISIWFALYKELDFQRELFPKLNLPLLPSDTAVVIAIDVTGKNEPIQTYIKKVSTDASAPPWLQS